MSFSGLAVLWICTLAGRRLTGWQAWAPALVVAVGLVTASLYSVDRVVHFIVLGLVWGLAWMLLSYVVYRQATQRRSPAMVVGTSGAPDLDRPAARTFSAHASSVQLGE